MWPNSSARAQGEWSLTKTANPTTFTAAGQTITYTYVITKNLTDTGGVGIHHITLVDDRFGPITCPDNKIAGDAPASMTCIKTYQTTAADVLAGSVTNIAVANGLISGDDVPLAPVTASATVTFAGTPSWTLTKTPSPTTYTAAGQTISYAYTLTNTGNVAISAISVTDNKAGTVSCPATTLAAGASMNCTATYVTTAGDVESRSVTNTATANGTPASGTLTPATATATVTLAGNPSWTLTKSANPTTYSAVGQTIAYTYVLTNTGNSDIASISLTDNKVAGVSCPSTTLATGGSMTCTGSYVITAIDIANRSVTNTATATGTATAGALAPVSATATITGTAGAIGSITIIKRTSGGRDFTFNFTTTIGGTGGFTLTTASGTATRVFTNVAPGTYTLSEVDLPQFWRLTALSCGGDAGGTPTTVNLATRTVSIGLDAGEAIVCTFTNTVDTDTVITTTSGMIAGFLNRRLGLLMEEPDRARFLRRAPGSLWGDSGASPGQANASGRPFNFTGSSEGPNSRMSFSTSLSQIAQANAAAEAREPPKGALAYAPRYPTKAPSRFTAEPGVDVWVETHYKRFFNNGGGVSNDGHFGIAYLGADYLATSSMLIGALVQFDWMSERTNAGTGVNGRGAMFGPYLSMRLTPELFFDARAAWGISSNSVNPFGFYSDSFSTNRWLLHAKLSGNWRFGDFRVTPSVAFDYGQEYQFSYTDTLNVLIPSQTVALGRFSFGPEIARRFIGNDGIIYEPMVSVTGQWDFRRNDLAVPGLPAIPDAFHAKAAGGLMARSADGKSVRLVATYDGLFSSNFHTIGAEVWVNLPLN